MSYINFLDLLWSTLIEKHNWIQNLIILENPILAPYTFICDFSLFEWKNHVKKKQHFFLRHLIKNLFHRNCSIGQYTTFPCNRFLLFPFFKKCFFLTSSIILSEKLPDLTKFKIFPSTLPWMQKVGFISPVYI